jgi:Dolichyl-phosphate-mannose-protein mannosyltransferase
MARDAPRLARLATRVGVGENGTAMSRPRMLEISGLAAVVAVGFMLRAIPIVGHAWPVGDGGLFYQMVGELRANGLAIPAFTAYDHASIPFAYPPLALELAAIVESVTGLARADVFRWLPLTFATLCIPAVYLLALELQPDRLRALFATLVYATLPYAWEWLTMGSGVTRSLGGFLALLAVWQGLRMYREGSWVHVLATGVLAGLAVLSHPEAGPFVAIALGVRLIFDFSWRNLRNLVLAGIVGVLVISPWVVVVVARHGIGPFRAAAGVAHDPVASLVLYAFGFFIVSPLPIAALLDLLGQVHDLLARRPFLVVWRFALCFLDLRFALVAAVIPLSLLAADGFFEVLLPAVRSLMARGGRSPGVASLRGLAWATGIGSLALLVSGLLAPSVFLAPHVALSSADRAAMDWVRATQPVDRRFVVLATDTWGSDDLSEWFPALTGHASLDTSQGLEWVDPATRQAEADAEKALRACEPSGIDCLATWLAAHGGPDAAVYVPAAGSAFAAGADPSRAIRTALLASPAFHVIYRGPAAVILVPAR